MENKITVYDSSTSRDCDVVIKLLAEAGTEADLFKGELDLGPTYRGSIEHNYQKYYQVKIAKADQDKAIELIKAKVDELNLSGSIVEPMSFNPIPVIVVIVTIIAIIAALSIFYF